MGTRFRLQARHFWVAVVAALVGAASPGTWAQSREGWVPDGPVTIILPYGPTSGPNVVLRKIGERLERVWKQPVLVENLPGSEGLIGTRKAISARPDGRTLLMQLTSVVLTKHIPGLGGADPVRELLPIAGVATAPLILSGSRHVKGDTLREMIQSCKSGATPCSIGIAGNMSKIASMQLKADSGLPDLIVVNYRDASTIMSDLIGGRLSFALGGVGAGIAQFKAGTVKPIALAAPSRYSGVPDVPTTVESGMPNYQYFYWYAFFAPKGTAPEVVRSVAAALREIVKDPDLAKTAEINGAEMIFAGPEELARHLETEAARYERLARLYPLQ